MSNITYITVFVNAEKLLLCARIVENAKYFTADICNVFDKFCIYNFVEGKNYAR